MAHQAQFFQRKTIIDEDLIFKIHDEKMIIFRKICLARKNIQQSSDFDYFITKKYNHVWRNNNEKKIDYELYL